MAALRAICKYVVIVAIITSHEIYSTQGRQLKSTDKEKRLFPAAMPNPRTVGFGQSVASKTDDFRATNPGNSPGVGHSANNYSDAKSESGNAFETTATGPGHSPGAGHSFQPKHAEPKV